MILSEIKSAYFGGIPVKAMYFEGNLVWPIQNRILDEFDFPILQENGDYILTEEQP